MKYYLSHVLNVKTHNEHFTKNEDGDILLPYILVGERAYVMVEDGNYEDKYGNIKTRYKRSDIDLSSVALIITENDYTPSDDQILYEATHEGFLTCKQEHPEHNYKMLSRVELDGQIIPSE